MVVNIHRKRLQGQSVPSTYSFRIIKKSGEIVWIEASVVLVTWEGSPAALTFLRDITVQKKLENSCSMPRRWRPSEHLPEEPMISITCCWVFSGTSLMLMKTDKNHPFYENLKIIERQVESKLISRRLLGLHGRQYDKAR
jgi:hypothetical protein